MPTNANLSTTNNWLVSATTKLEGVGVATARLDSLILLEDATRKDRAWLLAHPEYILQEDIRHILEGRLARRLRHEPLAYIRGKSEFYGREFLVTADTLQPRPETETMIELLKKHCEIKNCTVVDVGTGSGCLAITVKLEQPEAKVLATDISEECLKIARQNAELLSADIMLLRGNLLAPLSSKIPLSTSIILANLPYVPSSHTINQAAMFEPKIAIFGGEDGLDMYRKMFEQISKIPQKPLFILTESLPFQHDRLEKIAKDCGYKQNDKEDFIQVFVPTHLT